MTSRERVFHGTIASEHVAQLFDETESMIVSMAAFLGEGWQRGDSLLIVARPAHWALTSGELAARGCPVADAIADGRLVALDAATTMGTFMVNGEPDRAKFDVTVGAIVERLSAGGTCGITIYGEMVDLLAAQGNFTAAEKLEALWNDLSSRCSLRLLCGYSSSHFGDERTAAHLNAICGAHMAMRARPADLLAAWLLANRRSRYHLERQ